MFKNKTLLFVLISFSILLIHPACRASQEHSSNFAPSEPPEIMDDPVHSTEVPSLDNEEIAAIEEEPADTGLEVKEPDSTLPSEQVNNPTTAKAFYENALISESRKFIGTETAQSIVNQLGFIDGQNESVSNACGPLSIAILRDAGLISGCVSLHDIWLLSLREPDNQLEILYQNYFPPQLFDYIWINESVRTFDFGASPLKPGDWLFLFTAGNGFDHMLTVTKVDQNGAAYSVTNIDRGEGFIISEEVLYDPMRREKGLFFELSDNERKNLGKTGTQGFLLVRRKGGLDSIPSFNRETDIDLRESAYWRIYLRDINSGRVLFESLPNQRFHPASMVKPPIALAALKILEDRGFQISDLSSRGCNGRTFDQLFYAMIVLFEEDAADRLIAFIRENGGERRILDSWGMVNTSLEPRLTTALDLDLFLNGLYKNEFLSPNFHDYLLTLMKEKTKNDSAYLGVISEVIPDVRISNKRGLLLAPTIVSDMGIIEFEDKAYSIVISGSLKKDGITTYEALQESLEDFIRRVGEMLLAN